MSAKKNIAKLPEQCFGILISTGEVILIRAGEPGYYKLMKQPPLREGESVAQFVDQTNASDGVTKAQRSAMEYGSMFGWHCPAADPDHLANNL